MCASFLARNIRFYLRWIPSELNSGDFGSGRYDPCYDPSKTLVDRIGSNPGFEKQVYGQPQKPAPLVATEFSSSKNSSGATLLSYTGADSKGDPHDEVAPAQPGEISRNHQGFAAPPGDRTTHRRRHRGRRGGARHQRQRQRSALLSECQKTRASKAKTGAAPHPSRRNERARTLPGLEPQRADARQVSGGDPDFLAVGRQDESTTGFRVPTGRWARPVDEHDVRRRTQSLASGW